MTTKEWLQGPDIHFIIEAPTRERLEELIDMYLENYPYGGYGTRIQPCRKDEWDGTYYAQGYRQPSCE